MIYPVIRNVLERMSRLGTSHGADRENRG